MLARRPAAFSLVELLVVLAVLASLAQGFYWWKGSVQEDAAIERTVRGFLDIDEALYAYRIEHAAWPGDITEVAPFLPNLVNVDDVRETAGANGVGLPYSIAASGVGIEIGTRLLSESQARGVALAFPNTATVDADTLEVTIGLPVPGLEISHEALLARDGTRPMTGTLYLDGHDIADVGEIELDELTFSAPATIGGACSTNGVATTGDGILCCASDTWQLCLAAGGGGTAIYEGNYSGTPVSDDGFITTISVPVGYVIGECSLRVEPRARAHRGLSLMNNAHSTSNVFIDVRSVTITENADTWSVRTRTHHLWHNLGTPRVYESGNADYRITCNAAAAGA